MSKPPGKADERAHLHSIQPEIDRALRARRERERLEANAKQQKRMRHEAKKPWLERSIDVPIGKYRKEQQDARRVHLADQISVTQAKARERAQRRNAAEPPVPLDSRPTEERIAKAAGIEEHAPPIRDDKTRALTRVHTVQGAVDFYGEKWGPDAESGARHLVSIYLRAITGQPMVTGSYDGIPAGAFGARAGGVADGSREAYVRCKQIESELFARFGNQGVSAVRWFVWETFEEAGWILRGSLRERMAQFGRMLAPGFTDQSALWGITFGFLKAIFLYSNSKWVRDSRAMERHPSTPEEVRARLAQRREQSKRLQHEFREADSWVAAGLPRLIKGGRT